MHIDEGQFGDGDWFTLAAILLYKLGGSADLTVKDTMGPLGQRVEITQTPDGMHMRLVNEKSDA